MEYPEEVQKRLDVLNEYDEDENISMFDILHIYPTEDLAYPNGYYDSRYFKLVGYNSIHMKKRDLGKHDGMTFDYCNLYPAKIDIIRVFVDGSILIRFIKPVRISNYQNATIYGVSPMEAIEKV